MEDTIITATQTKPIQVVHSMLPTFVHDNETIPVIAKMFRKLSQFESELEEMEREGYTKCFFYSLNTIEGGYIIRRRYVK